MLSDKVVKILQVYQNSQQINAKSFDDDETKVKVNEFTSKIAFVYEKLRNTIDYKEEHLLRKNAIERILKRSFWEISNKNNFAESMIKELIRAGYLLNKSIHENKIYVIDDIFNKYLLLLNALKQQKNRSEFNKLQEWFIGLCACEIEQQLYDTKKEKAIVEAMFRSLINRLEIQKTNFDDKEIELQLYLAVNKALVRSDTKMIGYLIFKSYYPDWKQADENTIKEVIVYVNKIRQEIDKQIDHPLNKKLLKLCKKYAIYYKVLEDIIDQNIDNIEQIFTAKDNFETATREIVEKNYKLSRKKFRRSLVRSIIYIFLTKVVVALLVEVPLDMYLFHGFSYFSVGMNVLFPPFLMFLVGISIRHPSEKNTKKIVNELIKIVYDEEDDSAIIIRPTKKRGSFTLFVFGLMYLTTYLITFGGITYGLYKLNFSPPSGAIFLGFLCIVSFFAFKIRSTAKEWFVLKRNQGFFATIFDFMFMPIIKVGRWMSLEFSKINVFMFILDFIIEAPFKTFLAIFEDWMSYVREKKEEIY